VLTDTYGYALDETALEDYPELHGFRSVWIDGYPPRLLLNGRLLPEQKAFVLGREIGYRYLKLRERAMTSSPAEVFSFAQVFNDFKASYFAGALLMNRDRFVADLQAFFRRKRWDAAAFLALLTRYAVTPEMFFYRLSELMPTFFDLPHVHFLRFHTQTGSQVYHLTKHLNMSELRIPHGIGLHEHYCRRWLAVRLLRELEQRQQGDQQAPLVGVQRSVFLESEAKYFCVCLARPLVLTAATNTSVTLGFQLDTAFKKAVGFWNDTTVPRYEIHETCERCPLTPTVCADRAASAHIYNREQAVMTRNAILNQLIMFLKTA
jgi:Zn-dependent peptidase ImmA (M78 family)